MMDLLKSAERSVWHPTRSALADIRGRDCLATNLGFHNHHRLGASAGRKGDPGGEAPHPLIYWGDLSVTGNGDLPLAIWQGPPLPVTLRLIHPPPKMTQGVMTP
jgi:hypothetical protein